jgi:DNA modification methylase
MNMEKDMKKRKVENKLNDFSGSEWATHSGSIVSYNGIRPLKQRIHGAAFPHSLAEDHIKMYTKKGDTILDPFMGVGTSLDAAAKLGRNGVGFEINKQFIKLAKKDLDQHHLNINSQKIIPDNIMNLLNHIKQESIDFIITSPPYCNLLNNIMKKFAAKCEFKNGKKNRGIVNAKPYSSLKEDLGNLNHKDFIEQIDKVFEYTYKVIKPDSYAVWVVKDFRDIKNKIPYINFHNDIINSAVKKGWILWDIRIYDQSKFRPLVVLGYPSRNYYLNIGHSYILIFKKPGKRE